MLEDHSGLVSALALAGRDSALHTTTGYLDRILRDPGPRPYAGSPGAPGHYYSMDGEERAQTPAPYVDRRVYTSWNAALAIAYLEADRRRDRPALREHAKKLLERLFQVAYRRGEGMSHAEGVGAQLTDQVWSLWAALRAAQAGLGDQWMPAALDLAGHLEKRYGDPRSGGYFDHAASGALGRLAEPIKPLAENSVAAMALVELDILAGDPDAPHLAKARRPLESVAGLPRASRLMAAAVARGLDPTLR